jgi:hypothetical protein
MAAAAPGGMARCARNSAAVSYVETINPPHKKRRRVDMAAGSQLDKRETASLIASDKVEGTNVYRGTGEKLGYIKRVMIDKMSGKVAYVVMSFGGFLGIGEDYYPLPWSLLKYNTNLDGYELDITDQQLKGAPRYGQYESWDWSDRSRLRSIDEYYQIPPQ